MNIDLNSYLEKIPYSEIIVPVVVAVLALIVANHGKKLLNFFTFLICAGVGAYAGYSFLFPYVESYLTSVPYAQYIVAGVLALVAAILCKIIYPIAFGAVFGYAAYLVIPTLAESVTQLSVVAEGYTLIIVAVAVGVLALILRGLIEMLGTAVGGAYGFYWALNNLLIAVTTLAGLGEAGYELGLGAEVLVIVVVALIGFVKQVKNRHRF